MTKIKLPPPDLQIGFAELLRRADEFFLQPALLKTVATVPLAQIDAELHALRVEEALGKLATAGGLRGELVFPVPSMLRANPRLMAYYRLLFGFSQKEFYLAKHGTAPFKAMEESGEVSAKCAGRLHDLCASFAICGTGLGGWNRVGSSEFDVP